MKQYFTLTLFVIFLCVTQGCLVSKAKYEEKSRETEIVREGLAECQKRTNALTDQIEEMNIKVEMLKGEIAKNRENIDAKSMEVDRYRTMAKDLKKTYDTTKISRETLINELLDKEKKYSSLINELSVKNIQLETNLEKLKKELERSEKEKTVLKTSLAKSEKKSVALKGDLEKRAGEVDTLGKNVKTLSSKVQALEGKTVRLSENVEDILPLSTARKEASDHLAKNISPTFLSKDISILLASIPSDLALDKKGGTLSPEFTAFLKSLGDVCTEGKGCSVDIIARGRTRSGEMEILVELKNREIAFLRALNQFLKSPGGGNSPIRKRGRITVVEKMGFKGKELVEVRIYLVRKKS